MLTSCTGVEKWRRAVCRRVDARYSHGGGGKKSGKPYDRTGLVRGAVWAEVVVIDRYVGRIVHGSVPGCRFHPRSTERR